MHKFSKVKLQDQYVVHMGSVLGKGATGCVYEGTDLKNNSKVAVKVIELKTIDNQVTQYLLKMQKTALMELCSPYVLRGLKIVQDSRYCFMVTEYCNGGTLKKYIKDHRFLDQEKSLNLIKSLLEGYQNLVQRKVIHRDLKPANIMLHNQVPKIIDFGYCEIAGYTKPTLQYNVGSPSYMAPESYSDNIYNEKTQIWAFGVILFECLTGRTLDEGLNMEGIYKAIFRDGVPFPSTMSDKCKDIIGKCLKINPKQRPTCSQLLRQYFYNPSQNRCSIKSSLKIIEAQKQPSTPKTIDTDQSTKKFPSTSSSIFQTPTLQNADKNDTKNRNMATQRTERTFGGILTNHHQRDMNKYVNNRIKPAFSHYERNDKIQQVSQLNNFPIPIIADKKFVYRPTTSVQNEYGLCKENITNNHMFNSSKQPSNSHHQASVFHNFATILSNPNTPNNACNPSIRPQLSQNYKEKPPMPVAQLHPYIPPTLYQSYHSQTERPRTFSYRV